MNHPFSFRPGTCDEEIFRAVVVGNEYRLPDRFETDDIILDVGTHIGSFSYASVLRGSCNVHTFEAFHENFEAATRNLATLGKRVKVYNCAVWRSDRKNESLYFNSLEDVNNAAGHVLGSSGTAVKAIGLDRIIRHVTNKGRKRIRMIKMDCEGSEYPILLTAQRLKYVDAIVGEYHNITDEHEPTHPFHHIPENAWVVGYERFNIDILRERLRQEGFDVHAELHPTIPRLAGWFFAERPRMVKARSVFRTIVSKAKHALIPAS